MKTGIIGVGIMGSAIARNLIAAGLPVIGFDVAPERQKALAAMGGTSARTAAEVASSAEIILTSLPSIAALDETAAAIRSAARRGTVVAELSTLPIEVKQRSHDALAASDITLLDCPLSGTGAQAVTRDLVVFASGERQAVERCAPVFAGFARLTHYLGGFGNGSKMKFVANLLVAIHNVATAEAMVLGLKAGLAAEDIVKVIASGAGNSRVFELRAPLMAKNSYKPPTMKNDVWTKDLKVIGEFAKSLKVDTPLFAKIAALNKEVIKLGYGDSDTAAVCALLEKRAKLKRKKA
jgi:3-hydroxyisobutyrate dehydrogenase-like beta-hydroxyacid dehydrogenase